MNYTFRFSGREWFETLPKDVQDEWIKEVDLHKDVIGSEKILSDDYRWRRCYVITSLVLLESKKLSLYS